MSHVGRDGNGGFIVIGVIAKGVDCGGSFRNQRGGDMRSESRREYGNRLSGIQGTVLRQKELINLFYIGIVLVLRKREVNMAKNGVNNTWLKVFYESAKPVGMKDRKNVSREGIEGKVKGNIFIIDELKTLSARDPME